MLRWNVLEGGLVNFIKELDMRQKDMSDWQTGHSQQREQCEQRQETLWAIQRTPSMMGATSAKARGLNRPDLVQEFGLCLISSGKPKLLHDHVDVFF